MVSRQNIKEQSGDRQLTVLVYIIGKVEMGRLISCKYCGKIHASDADCGMKPRYEKKRDDAVRFRSTRIWRSKREEIKRRDNYLCQVCLEKLYDTIDQYTFKGLEVHHIVPVNEDYSKRLDNDNLITLCSYHHKQAERNKIPRELLRNLIKSTPGDI